MKLKSVFGIVAAGLVLFLLTGVSNGDPFWHLLPSNGLEYNGGVPVQAGGTSASPASFDVFTVGTLGTKSNVHFRFGEPFSPGDGGANMVKITHRDSTTTEQALVYMRRGDTIFVNPVDGGVLYEFNANGIKTPNGSTTGSFLSGADAGTAGGVLSVTFSSAFLAPPSCVCSDVNASPAACGPTAAPTTTGATFAIGEARADAIDWHCSR